MNILAVNGSPRKKGRLSRIIENILEQAKTNHHCQVVHLADLKLKDCTGCMSCQEKGACITRDDIVIIEEAIKKADLIIWASPTHWGNVSVLMLRLYERLFGFFIEEKKMGTPLQRHAKGKKALLVTACSTPFPFNWLFKQSSSCISRMHEICKYSGQEVIGTFTLPGTIDMNEIPEKYLVKARKLGSKI